MKAEFWVVQHIADSFRNESRNVGVIVRLDGGHAARFFAEDSDLSVDGRKLKRMPSPGAYRQWVRYWRKHLTEIRTIVETTTENYKVLSGGELTNLGTDSISEVADYLYSALVSEGGFAEAYRGSGDVQEAVIHLKSELDDQFRELALFATLANGNVEGHHLIEKDRLVPGKSLVHTPSYSQVNGVLCVMEPIDLTLQRRKIACDHAGMIAYMFRDIRDGDADAESVSIVRVDDSDMADPAIEYAMKALRNESEVVYWTDADQRTEFLESRRDVAFAVR